MKIQEILTKSSIEAAPLLLGCFLYRKTPSGILKLKIVETEAYHQDDPASHSYRGMTKRTAPMFEAGGVLYVYFTYGMHYCVNIVTGQAGRGEAVLLRAAEPLEGLDIMRKNRGITDIKGLANGPAKLTQALGIKNTSLSGEKLSRLSIWLEPPDSELKAKDIIASPRVGIKYATDMPWRFYINGSPFVSRINI
ncbi:DNA-3-methyladenine glycosylase [Candidatus Saccharibacteria bacterium]|nr:DNA-3-methyladenine glycosylase [Candidatus Saccharibacteria bacterium]